MANAIPNIFEYLDYRLFLRDWIKTKQGRKGFSLRSFARDAGFKSPHIMQLVNQGKRNLSVTSMFKFAKGLRLSETETQFFTDLVHFTQADGTEEKAFYFEKIATHPGRWKAVPLERSQFSFFRSWLGPVLYEMAAIPGFEPDPKWIASRLRMQTPRAEIKALIQELIKTGLATLTKGKFSIAAERLDTGDDIRNLHLYAYHEEALTKAVEALPFPQDKRYFQVTTVAARAALLPQLVELAKRFEEEALALIESDDGPKDQVLQVGLQIFPFLKEDKK